MSQGTTSLLENVVQTSSIPAAGIFANRSAPKLRKRIWIIVIATGAVAFAVHMIVLTVRLAAAPVMMETTFGGIPLIFPDVTLCHTGPYSMMRTSIFSNISIVIEGENKSTEDVVNGIKNFWKSLLPEFRYLSFNEYTRKDNVVSRNSLYEYGIKYGLGHQVQEVIIGCFFRNRPCSFLNFTTVVLPGFLNCFTFRPSEPSDRLASRPGEEEGLSLILMDTDRRNIMTEMETLDFIRGLTVFLHAPNTSPNLHLFEVAQVGLLTKIGVEMTKYIRINRDTVSAPCIDNGVPEVLCPSGSPSINTTFAYSAEMCRLVKIQESFVSKCRCLSENLPVTLELASKRLPFCHYVPPFFLTSKYRRNGHIVVAGMRVLNMSENADELPADLASALRRYKCHKKAVEETDIFAERILEGCSQLCDSNVYTMYSSKFNWPAATRYARGPLKQYGGESYDLASSHGLDTTLLESEIMGNNMTNLTKLRRHFLRLMVFPRDGSAVRVHEALAYPWSAFLSDIGGILGLWVGFSIITIVEVLEWTTIALLQSYRRQAR